VWLLGSYSVGCLEHKETDRCEDTTDGDIERKCYCLTNLCNSSSFDIIDPALLLVSVSLSACISRT